VTVGPQVQTTRELNDDYTRVAELDEATLEMHAQRLELRAADERQRAMRHEYLSRVEFRERARVLEVGCGTGPVARDLASWPRVHEVVGVDPSPFFLDRARALAAGISNLRFELADGRVLPFPDSAFDVVVFHTTLCHVPGPDEALREAFRVLRPGGQLAVFDGDYTTLTVALAPDDPLQPCAEAVLASIIHDPWLVRRLRPLAAAVGFEPRRLWSHGYVETEDPRYMLAVTDLGADALASSGRVAPATAEALKQEARRRAAAGTFFGHIAYASLVARRAS
jgi:ubiquinone/menaquinone biosynthesis C-methylase UbiE